MVWAGTDLEDPLVPSPAPFLDKIEVSWLSNSPGPLPPLPVSAPGDL